MNTNEKVEAAFNHDRKSESEQNTNHFTPKHGVNDADRIRYFGNYNRDLILRIQQIKNNNKL